MGLKKVKHLDKEELGDLYEGNMLQLIVDLKTEQVFHVPSSMKHIDAVCELLDKEEWQINKKEAEHLVSAYIIIENNIVKGMAIGHSSFEARFKIHHSIEQKAEAEILINNIIRLSKQLKEVA